MKKLFALILILVYGVTSFGMTMHLHYCCGKLDKVSFTHKFSNNCKFNKTGISTKGCCDNKDFEFKIKADQQANAKQVLSFLQSPVVILSLTSSTLFISRKLNYNALLTGPPPIITSTPLFVQYCNYRI